MTWIINKLFQRICTNFLKYTFQFQSTQLYALETNKFLAVKKNPNVVDKMIADSKANKKNSAMADHEASESL